MASKGDDSSTEKVASTFKLLYLPASKKENKKLPIPTTHKRTHICIIYCSKGVNLVYITYYRTEDETLRSSSSFACITIGKFSFELICSHIYSRG